MIYIFAGHHDKDPGAVANGQKEADLTKELRQLIIRPFEDVTIDDDADTLSTLLKKIGKLHRTDYVMDIHFNSVTNPKATGTEVFITDNDNSVEREWAQQVVDTTANILGINNRGIKTESQAKRGRLGILHTGATTILWEVCFMSNPDDLGRYHANKEALACAIANLTLNICK